MGSIRFKITVLLLTLSLGEAVILSVIGFSSVNAEGRSVDQLRQAIGSLDKKDQFVLSLSRAIGQSKMFPYVRDQESFDGFDREWSDVERRLRICDSFQCHGVARKPKGMLAKIWPSANKIRDEWDRVLAGGMTDEEVRRSTQEIERQAVSIVRLTDEMARKIQERMRSLDARTQESRQAALVLIGVMTLVTVLAGIGFSYVLVSSVTRPLQEVVAGARHIAAGHLDHRVPVRGGGETALLARAFNEMAEDLSAHQSWLKEEIRRRDATLSATERLATIGLVASTVAHELNNPLTSVLMNAGLAAERIPDGNAARPFVERIIADGARCRSILGSVRAMATRRIGELSQCNVQHLLAEAIRVTRPRAEPRRVTLKVLPAEVELDECRCDRQKMLQVLVNLIDNAVDASAPNGQVELSASSSPAGTIFRVRDEGTGISPDDRGQVFEQFRTSKDHGVGLGLAIARHIVQEHGGTITFESTTSEEAGQAGGSPGTTFTIVLPQNRESGA